MGSDTNFGVGFIQMKGPKCPQCNSGNTCPIIYGYPADVEKFLDGEAKGEFKAGGCVIGENSPKWNCKDCNNQWGRT